MEYEDYFESKNMKLYLEQISKFPVCSEEEEKKLGELIQGGDRTAQKKLIESNLKFVVSYVKKYKGMGLSMLDLINQGNLGLIEAAKRFDPGRNVKFISYAVWWIRQAIIHALSQSARICNLPQKLSDQISQMRKNTAQLKTELGREPTREEVAKAMNITVEDVEELEMLAEKDISLSAKIHDSDLEYEEKLEDSISPSVECQIVRSSVHQEVRNLLDELDEKEALVLKLRFGLDDDRPRTLQEVGDMLGLTRERIRQIEQKAMRKLARSHKLQQLRGYIN